MQLNEGQIISQRYKILEVIGKGGMAIVYKANDLKLGRDVTFKVLKDDYIDDEAFINRFSTEARAAAQLAHTNIVNVYDVGNDGDIHYIVMEYIDGYTLKELIYKKAPLDNNVACDIAMQIAAGLENAHAHGVIHRDIKPENILLTKIGGRLIAKVTDFGIAKANSMENTQGDYMGSVHYFSPEQAKGENVDRRSDIYSLGIVFYEMVTGSIPFDGGSALDLAMKHIKSPLPNPCTINPKVTDEIAEVIKKACAKEPKNRYQNARAMETAIKKAVENKEDNQGKGSKKKAVPVIEDIDEEDEETLEIKRRERNVIITAVITGVLIILLITFGGSMLNKTLYGDSIKVPDFVGMTYEKACRKAEKKGLTIEREEVYKEDVDAGCVAEQSPEKGERVEKGGVVVLYVSFGPGDIQVPNVEGMLRSQAEEALLEMGLALGDVEYVNSDKPVGEVIEQEPKEGEFVAANAKINVKVSQGDVDEEVPVPDLKLKTQEEAAKILDGIGLSPKFIDGYSDTVPVGSVIDQGITASTLVPLGSQITITISRGERADMTETVTSSLPGIIDIIETTTEAVNEEPTTEAATQQEAEKPVSISVNPDKSKLLESNNAVKVIANKDGKEIVLKELTLNKNEFPFDVNDVSDGNTKYTIIINGSEEDTVTK